MIAEKAWDYLLDHAIATEDELRLVTDGWGMNIRTLETVLYSRTGYDAFPDDSDTELE